MKEKKTEMIGIKVTSTLKRKLIEIAESEDRSISYIANQILEDYFKKETASKEAV